MSKMHVQPHSQNPWQLVLPHSSVLGGGVGCWRCCRRSGVWWWGCVAFCNSHLSTNTCKDMGFAFNLTGADQGRQLCMTVHARPTSLPRSHCRQQAYPTVNGCTTGRHYPSTHLPTGQYHSTDLGKQRAMHQQHSSAYPFLPLRDCPNHSGQEGCLSMSPMS